MSLKQDATFLLRWCGGDAIERIVNIMRMTVVVAIIMFNIVAQAAEPFPPLSAVPGPEVNREKVEAEYLARAKQGAEEHRKAEATFTFVDEQGKPLTGVPVQIRQTKHEFLFGCVAFELTGPLWSGYQREFCKMAAPLFSATLVDAERWKERFSGLFNFAILPFYWAHYEKTQGCPEHEALKEALAWCKQQGITTKGHPLVWPHHAAGKPKWVAAASQVEVDMLTGEKTEIKGADPSAGEKKQKIDLQLNRVRREVGRFAGEISIWDVYNEAAWARGLQATKEAEFIDKAFRAAYEANPKAHLILNDAGMFHYSDKREGFYRLVAELKRRGTPISGIGIQGHIPETGWFVPERVWQTLDLLGGLGLPIHITEFTPQSSGKQMDGGWRKGTWTELAQADFAEQFYRLCFGHPAVASINWWGLSDRAIWLPDGGLLNKEYKPKPVYNRLLNLIQKEWKTNLDVPTDEKGQVNFRGFCGNYTVSIRMPDGRIVTWKAGVTKGCGNQHAFTVQ